MTGAERCLHFQQGLFVKRLILLFPLVAVSRMTAAKASCLRNKARKRC